MKNLALILLVVALPADAWADETPLLDEVRRFDYHAREFTGENVVVLRLNGGTVTTQEPLWSAYFEGFRNPALAPSTADLNWDQQNYVTFITDCLTARTQRSWFATDEEATDFNAEIAAFVRYYVTLLAPSQVPDVEKYPVVGVGVRDFSCGASDRHFGVAMRTPLAGFAWSAKNENTSWYSGRVRPELQARGCGGPPLPFADMAFIFFLRSELGKVLRNYEFPSYGLDPLTETPDAIFTCKTSPWLYSNAQAFDPSGRKPTWNELGMNEYYAWGHTRAHSWIAQQLYYETTWGTIMEFTPLVGSALAVTDAFLDLKEGWELHGLSTKTMVNSGVFALNYFFAALDVVGAEALARFAGATAAGRIKQLRSLARKAASPDDVAGLLGELRRILRGSGALGENVATFRGLFGTPLRPEDMWQKFMSGWRSFDLEASQRFGAAMHVFLNGGRTPGGTRVIGAKEYIQRFKTEGIFSGSVETLYRAVKNTLEDAASFATQRSQRPYRSETEIWVHLEDAEYARWKPRMNPEYGGAFQLSQLPADIRAELAAFVRGPGGMRAAPPSIWLAAEDTWWFRNIEQEMNGTKHLVKQVWVTESGSKGAVKYVADEAARTAMETEMKALFAEAMRSDTSIERIMEIGIRMEWLVNQVLPYMSQSSSIAQAWKHVILESRGLELGRMEPGIGFDLKSWTRTFDQYYAEHPSYYDRFPELLGGPFTDPMPDIPTMPGLPAPREPSPGILKVRSAIELLVTSGGLRTFTGWIANDAEFHEWETGEDPSPADIDALPDPLQNPLPFIVQAFEIDAFGRAINFADPIATGVLTDPPADFDIASYSEWFKPGFSIDIPESFADGTFGIWVTWLGTEKRKRLDGPETTYHLYQCNQRCTNCYAMHGSNETYPLSIESRVDGELAWPVPRWNPGPLGNPCAIQTVPGKPVSFVANEATSKARFVRWESAWESHVCPCEGSTDKNCTFTMPEQHVMCDARWECVGTIETQNGFQYCN